MKKLLLIFSLLAVMNYSLSGRPWADIRMAQPLFDVKWSPLQISIWPVSLVPAVAANDCADIYGLNLNLTTLFHCQKIVYGISCGIFQASEKHCGMTVALINGAESTQGLAVGIANIFQENKGVCIGVINDVLHRNGVQTAGEYQRRPAPNWLQIGIFNHASEGVQFGLLNAAEPVKESKSVIQIGLLNYNPQSLIPWLPLINWDMKRPSPKEPAGAAE